MEASVTWNGGMSFTGVADSGFAVELDTDPSVGGNDNGVRPLELMALSLIGCTAMDVISIMRIKRENVTRFEVKTHIERSPNHPKVFTSAVIEYIFYGHGIKSESAARAIELSEQVYCPAQAMLKQIMPIELKYTILEEEAAM